MLTKNNAMELLTSRINGNGCPGIFKIDINFVGNKGKIFVT